jgi:hypothetical protein
MSANVPRRYIRGCIPTLDSLRQSGVLQGATRVHVAHDAWCPRLQRGGPCRCQPAITIMKGDTPGNDAVYGSR